MLILWLSELNSCRERIFSWIYLTKPKTFSELWMRQWPTVSEYNTGSPRIQTASIGDIWVFQHTICTVSLLRQFEFFSPRWGQPTASLSRSDSSSRRRIKHRWYCLTVHYFNLEKCPAHGGWYLPHIIFFFCVRIQGGANIYNVCRIFAMRSKHLKRVFNVSNVFETLKRVLNIRNVFETLATCFMF